MRNIKKNIIVGFVLLSLFISLQSTIGFIPDNEVVKLYTYSDVDGQAIIRPNTLVNFSIVIRNLTNNTIYNLTVQEEYARPFQTDFISLYNTPAGVFDGVPINNTFASLGFVDQISKANIHLNFLNVTLNNFTLNISELETNGVISIGYTLNFTREDVFAPEPTTLTYYDHWGDMQLPLVAELSPGFNVEIPEVNIITSFLHVYSSEDKVNFGLILWLVGITLLIAFLGRGLYVKNPFKL